MDVFVLPTERAGLSVTVLEAMSRGIPTVATNAGLAGAVLEDGVNGRVIGPRDPEAIASAVISLLSDPLKARRLGDAGRRLVRERYPLDHMLEDMLGVYQDAVSDRPRVVPMNSTP